MCAILFGLSLFALGGPPAADDAKAKELRSLQTTWELESARIDGQPYRWSGQQRIAFSPERMTFTSKPSEGEKKGFGTGFQPIDWKVSPTYRVNQTTTPRQIDLSPGTGDERQGILELKGDRLLICWGPKGKRPTEFSSTKGSLQTLEVWKRVQAKEKTDGGKGGKAAPEGPREVRAERP
jgi:uncharacterized protein (TIGR03067 family)